MASESACYGRESQDFVGWSSNSSFSSVLGGKQSLTWFHYLLGEGNILHMLLGRCEDLVCGVSKVLELNKFSINITSY